MQSGLYRLSYWGTYLIFKDFPLLRRDGEQQTPADQVKNQRLHNTSHGGCQLFKI
jgi:hypothetical protein